MEDPLMQKVKYNRGPLPTSSSSSSQHHHPQQQPHNSNNNKNSNNNSNNTTNNNNSNNNNNNNPLNPNSGGPPIRKTPKNRIGGSSSSPIPHQPTSHTDRQPHAGISSNNTAPSSDRMANSSHHSNMVQAQHPSSQFVTNAGPPPQQKSRGRGSMKGTHSRSYPRGVGLDFRKLTALTLLGYIDHHGVNIREEAPPSELAVAVARHFENYEVKEDEVIGGFLSRLAGNGDEYARKTAHFDVVAPSIAVRKRRRAKNAARPSEQVAAKVTRTDENGSWILASVQRFYSDSETYDVQDEDDTSKLIRLPWNYVMRLSTGEIRFRKGAHVMAIFPETTSFYRAVVSKQPVWKLTSGSSTPMVKELIVKFEDDEDENGRTPHRRVPSRYVIPLPSQYFQEEEEDMDLNTPRCFHQEG